MEKAVQTLNEREQEIVQCLFSGWVESDDMPLYGGLSYQCVVELATKLGVEDAEERVGAKLGELQRIGAEVQRQMVERQDLPDNGDEI